MKIGNYASKKGWYWSVGDRFWKNSPYDTIGLGIQKPLLMDHDFLNVYLGGREYTLDCQKAIHFINTFNSYETIKGVRLGYISRSLFELQETKPEPKIEEIAPIQHTLL